MIEEKNWPRVVIIGGGFGGLNAAQELANKSVYVTLIDRKNHHTFQPLLYQVAATVLSPGEIATPLRHTFKDAKNINVILGEVATIDIKAHKVKLVDGAVFDFDYLIVAAGARHSYYGHKKWEKYAPGLKTIEDATEIRCRILQAFEAAEREALVRKKYQPLHFAIIGGGPTGVELAGAIADISRHALRADFRAIDPAKARISIYETAPRLLGNYSASLATKAEKQLAEIGVDVYPNSVVSAIEKGRIKVGKEWIEASVILWATGVTASPLGKQLAARTTKTRRVPVRSDLSISKDKNIFVIGDMAALKDATGKLVPALAAVATQQGKAAAKNILRDLAGKTRLSFEYNDKGSMATIGRNRTIAQIGNCEFSGFFAWLIWDVVHLALLDGVRNRVMVFREWLWAHYTQERSARLITDRG
jgi:NADH:ubiquinone reductase (H+-translocating)